MTPLVSLVSLATKPQLALRYEGRLQRGSGVGLTMINDG